MDEQTAAPSETQELDKQAAKLRGQSQMGNIEVVIRSGSEELIAIPFGAGDRLLRTEKSLRIIHWIISGVTREKAPKSSSRSDIFTD